MSLVLFSSIDKHTNQRIKYQPRFVPECYNCYLRQPSRSAQPPSFPVSVCFCAPFSPAVPSSSPAHAWLLLVARAASFKVVWSPPIADLAQLCLHPFGAAVYSPGRTFRRRCSLPPR
ncbi:hypothetical protein GQ42DRAFT_162528, partial [Ramicandelaber brevisporus]